MKYLFLLPLGVALLTTSCESTKVASNSSYQNNPYYGPSSSSYGNSVSDYSTTPSSVKYPTYADNTYTPPGASVPVPAPAAAPALPSVPSVPSYSSSTPSTYTAPPAPAPYTPAASSSSHVVGGGENLYRISLQHGTSVAAIKSANGLANDTIHPGQTLKIP